MRVLVRFSGGWGLGDLLCADPMIDGLLARYGPETEIYLQGAVGNLYYNPNTAGMADPNLDPDVRIEVLGHADMDPNTYGKLEALPSLVRHMCSYAAIDPGDRAPQVHLTSEELGLPETLGLHAMPGPRVAICADFLDPLRHWAPARWREVAKELSAAGASVVGVGETESLGVGHDFVGRLGIRETAAVIGKCELFLGNNSGLFHYAQAVGTPCVVLFSIARPERFVHAGALVFPVQAVHMACINCRTRWFAQMQDLWCVEDPKGRCMVEIAVADVMRVARAALAEIGAPLSVA